MEGLSWIDIFLRLIPEGLIIILAGYAISKKKVNVKLWFLSGTVLALLNFTYRYLPISRVLPMILAGISATIILASINKIKANKAILSTLICFVILTLSEFANMILLDKIFQLDTKKIFLSSNVWMKNVYGLPSLIIYGGIVVSFYFISIKRKRD